MPAATSVMSRATTHSAWRDFHPGRAPGPRNNRAATLRWSRYSSTRAIPIQADCCFIPLAPKAAAMCFTLADGSSRRSAIQPGARSPATVLYLFIFFSLSALLTIIVKHPSNALIFSFVIWLFFVLIVPQIGDTMDTDNQVPGGFFNAIHVNKEQSNIILKDFSTYEKLRNDTEEISITKHYERLVFAFLGIKDIYNGKSLVF